MILLNVSLGIKSFNFSSPNYDAKCIATLFGDKKVRKPNTLFKNCALLLLFSFIVNLSFSQQCTLSINGNNSISVCQNQATTLTASATGNPTVVWTSNPANGISSGGNTLNPTINTSVAPATYMLIVNGNNGQCLDTVNVTINPSPSTPVFTSNPSTVQCSGTPITFTVSNQQSNVIYSWDFGDGANGTGATTSHTYNSVGNGTASFNVIVTATFNGTGCSKNATATVIQVKQKPDASMVDINNTIQFTSCGGSNLSISVVNTSVVNSNNYRIQWGDGTPDYNSATFTTSPPGVSHNYIGLGYFNVVLTVTNTNGCSSQTRYSAYNGSNPQGGISNPGGTTGLCSPANINFPINNVSANTPGTIYILTPSDGSLPDTFQHPPPLFYSHTFNISSCGFTSPQFANSFYVQLRAVNQCDASGGLAEQITINSKPKVNFTISPDTIVCKNTTVSLTNTSDNGASVQSNLCDSTGIYNWIITPNSGYTIISGQLGSNPPIVALPSTWGSRNLQISFTVPGTYSITLKGRNKSNCGGDSIIKTICVQSPPTPSFIATPLTGCSPLVVNFTDNSSGTNQCGKITRLWTVTQTGSTCIQDSINDFAFSSGTNSASLNPVIRFNNQGTYTVTLSLTNKCGTFDTIQTFTVKRKPEVALSGIPPFLCAGLSITPTATYAPCLGTISTYAWSFPGGNPSSSISQTPGTITYPSAGNYSVSLAVTNECGTTTVSASITIQNAPVAVAGNDKLYCSGGNAQIGGASTGGNTYSWSPATGLSSTTVSNPTVTLAANGTTTVTQNYTVTVTNQAGCSATDTVIVTVYPPATVNAGPSVSMCNINTITLAGSFGGGASSVTWTSTNGGNFSNASSPTSTYTPSISSGIIILTLTTDDPTGPCSAASDSLVFTIFQTPTPNAGNDQSYCSGGSASIGSANVVGNTYSWSPSIGLSSTTVSNPIVTLAANGTTTVTQTYTVTATNQAGCSATDAVTVIVYPPATVNAGPSVTICNVNSTILAGTFGGGATGIVWTSNNGGTFSNLNSTISTFTPTITSGNANLTICTNDPSGPCPSVCDSMIVTVVQPPQANAGNDQPICSGGTVQVGVVPQSGYTYSWTPAGSVSNTTISNPTVTLTNNGTTLITQTLTLIVSATGCADTDQVVISVYPPAIANAGAATSVCYGDSVQLNGAISGAATSATWTSPNGTFTNASVLNTYFHPTITNGNATITLTTNDPTGPCPAATSTVIFTVNPIPTVTAIPNQTVCEGSPTTLVALSSPIAGTTFSWSGTSPNGITNFPSSGATSSIPSFTPNNPNTSAGTIIYTIIPTANGCVGTPITFNFTVNPSPNITTVPPQTVCSGQSHTAVVFASNVVNTTYSWSATTTAGVSVPITNGTASIPAQIATNTGTTNGTVTYTITPTANNCPGTSTTFVVTVYPTPAVNTIQPQTFCSGGQTTLVAPSSSVGGATFTWTAIGSANTNGFTPSGSGNIPAQIINYTGVTQGTVTYTIIPTANSCPGAPLDFVVTVYPIPTVVANPILDSICSGTQTNISLSSNVAASTFSWSVNQPASVSGATAGTGNAIQQTLINTSSSAQKVTYTVTPSVNNCPGSPLVVTVWVYPGITVSFSPSHQFICSGDTSVLVNITSPTPGVAFTWTSQANGVTGVIASGINTIPVQTLSNSTSAPINVVYLITANYAGCISQNANDTITVNPIPTVTNLLSQTVCEGIATQTINFTSAVTGTNFSWSGASSNGITGFTTNGNANTIPPQKLNNPNTTLGTVIYSITPNANGCPGLPVNYTITVNPTPNIILPADTVICNGNASNPISISSSVVGTAFSWTSTSMAGVSGNTANGNGNIPAQTFSNANNNISSVTYTIIANANTCVDTAIYTISVNPSPTVVFSLPNQTICSGTSIAQVNLTSSTPNANINWTANVPSGITGATSSGTSTIAIQNLTNTTFQPLTITYTAQAVTSGITCPGTTSTYTITVNPLPDLSLTPTLDTICSASQTNIQLSSNVVGTVFTWTVNTPPNISGQSGGTGNSITQTLLSTDANPQTVTYNITTNAATCPGQSASSSVIVNPSPTVQFSLPDQIICSDFATKAVQITSPTAGAVITWTATIPASISGATASGTSTIPVQTLTNSSNVPQQVIYNASVNFSACPGLANTYTITVNPTPHITNTDTVQTICSGDLSMAIPLVSDVTGVIFSWNGMGSATLSGFQTNGTTNTIPSQPISNSSNISDTVLYMVTPTAAGCVGPPQEFQIAVNPRPLISLIPDTQALCTNNLSVPIVITSNIATTTFSWSSTSTFVSGATPNGTGNIIPAQGLQNTSPIADTGFVVFIVASNAAGCPGQSIAALIQVNPKPIVNFAMNKNNGCSPLSISFASNTLVFGKPDSIVYNWGDGTPNTILYPNPIQPIWSTISHTFVNNSFNAVSFTISLTAYNQCGDTSVNQTITVQPNVVNAFFTPSVTQGCEPLTVSFNDFSTGSTFTSWCFDYDVVQDTCIGLSSVVTPGTTVQHTFNAGKYTVALYITDGCSQDTAFQTIIVSPSPVSDFTYNNNVCENTPVTFTQQSSSPSGMFLTAFNWQFGDGDSSLGNVVTHTYDSATVYNTCLIVSASNGCTSTKCHPVSILSKPVVNFKGYDTCVNTQPIQFLDFSTGVSFYNWNFGDGNTSTLATPTNNYTTAGTYNVTLVGSTSFCSDTISHSVIIYPKPTANFLLPATYICGIPAQFQITNTSTGALGYDWNFGNNIFSTATNPNATFPSAGSFNVTLIAANQFNCYDTAHKPIAIYPFPLIQSIDIEPAEGCQPLEITVTANATNGNLYIWDFGDGTSSVSLNTPSANYTYSDTGTYTISVKVYSFLDCGDTAILSDTIKVHIRPNADFEYLANTTVEPIDGTIVFTNSSQSAENYVWNFGDGFTSNEINPIHKYESIDDFTVTLIASNHFGCEDSISKSITVFKRSLWVPNAFAPDFGGGNDLVKVWQPIGIGLRTYRAQVFNTWGELLWESTKLVDTKPSEFWDGTYHGNLAQQDVYVWKVEAIFLDGSRWDGMTYEKGKAKKTIGSVTLIR